ncbi:hypothetical protein H6800_03465 [Candidatus Nomurabacteria bacterium]|nr:hypothetical protein [Candidatus Nomurabacteria bacterium]
MLKPYTTTQLGHEVGEVTTRVVEAARELPPPTINEVMDSIDTQFDERAIRSGIWEAISSGKVQVKRGSILVADN